MSRKRIKIGIFTYHFTINIGSFLQAYALQNKLISLGYECEFINYKKKNWKKADYKNLKNQVRKKFKTLYIFIWPIAYLLMKYREGKFYFFRKKYLKINSKKVISRKKLPLIEKKYDKFIVGSDQVWNYNNNKFDYTYLLDFVKEHSKKFAYAPSFGVDHLNEMYTENYAKLLSQFKSLSVREEQGKAIIYDLIKKDCPVLLDPVFLLNKEEWKKRAVAPKIKKEYVLLYLIEHSASATKFGEELASKTGCAVVEIVGFKKRKHNNIYVRNVSPIEWLGLFFNAKYIITNSFHGTACAINFRKDFFVEPIRGRKIDTNSRLYSIIDMLSLQKRIIKNGNNPNMLKEIDYNIVSGKLEANRKESLDYLKALAEDIPYS